MTTARAATLQDTLRLRKVPQNGLSWHHELRKGLPFRSLMAVAKSLKVPEKELLAVMELSPRIVAARKKAKRLTCAESDLAYAIARAYVRLASFKSLEEARTWLVSKVDALKGEIPLELLHTRLGTEYVMSVIERERALIVPRLLETREETPSEDEDEGD